MDGYLVRLGVFLYTDRLRRILPEPAWTNSGTTIGGIRWRYVVLVILHFNKLRDDVVDSCTLHCADRRFERGPYYVFDCGTLLYRFAASFSKSLDALHYHRFEKLRNLWDESHYAAKDIA